MDRKKNKLKMLIAIIIIAFLCIAVGKDILVKSATTVVASSIAGAPVNIGWMSLGIFRQGVRIDNFKMYNPDNFPKGIMIDIPKVIVRCNPLTFLSGKIHLTEVDFVLKEIILVKNKEGKMNVDELSVVKQQRQASQKKSKEMSLQIDLCKLNMGRLIMKDYSLGPEPVIKVYEINLVKEYKNITNAQQLTALILSEPMKAAGIQGAKIYGVSALAGVAFLPVAVGATFLGKDNAEANFEIAYDKVYEASLLVLKRNSRITREDKASGVIQGDSDLLGALTVKLLQEKKGIWVTVTARKFMLPKPEIAGGILYEISEALR
ncbi:MAG: hypothetical protein PHO70_03885 [Candidatus Omnitrophica bacterium]|nr:hypothetical protein [Candidatus Omnitrophota bacterium]